MAQAAIGFPGARSRGRAVRRSRVLRWLPAAAAVALAAAGIVAEARSSRLQASVFHALARAMQFHVVAVATTGDEGALPSVSAGPPGRPAERLAPPLMPRPGPYDVRLGHSSIPELTASAAARGFAIERRASLSPLLRLAHRLGIAPPFRDKPQAGLRILASNGAPLYATAYPERVYERFEDVPAPVVEALLFAENRELLDHESPTRNPVVEWDRLGRAALAYPLHWIGTGGRPFGGSTLATQIQKFRHSPGGRTDSPAEKLRQIAGATLFAYRETEDTTRARREIVLDYLNGVPLAALPGYGEVFGIPDGLRLWFGADFERTNALLRDPGDGGDAGADAASRGRAFREVLSLVLAAQRPSHFLRWDRADLERRTDRFLELMYEQRVLPAPLLAEARAASVRPLRHAPAPEPEPSREVAAPARKALLSLLDVPSEYALDRLDLSAESTLDARAQTEVSRLFHALRDPAAVRAAGLAGPRLLDRGDPALVNYSFLLYEREGGSALLRVHTDNFAGPFDLNDGARLDLGSTAKLRTLVTYLEQVAALHAELSGRNPAELRARVFDPADAIGRWAAEQLAARPDLSLEALLELALDRRYSASPAEIFFTGSGRHRFHNFDREDDHRVLTVREACRRSVNLVFVRLMRDVANRFAAQQVGDPTRVLQDETDPRRATYLERFAVQDTAQRLDRYRRWHEGASAGESLARLLPPARRSPARLAAVERFLAPDDPPERFAAAMRTAGMALDDGELARLYEAYAPERMGLADRAFVARVHPLELWLVRYLRQHPHASRDEIRRASGPARDEAYGWLFRTRRKRATDRAIRVVIERDAFDAVRRDWQRLGYPFADLVPSYATALGSSGDRPSALADLVGILVADGVREPHRRIERLRFAEGTPWETVMAARRAPAERLLAPEIARAVREVLLGTVDHGTARRAHAALVGVDGRPLPIGGKTGTGDHRLTRVGRNGEVLESRARARTATFAFFVGDRFYGVLTASVEGSEAEGYRFTSSLPVELVRVLAPTLDRMVAEAHPREPRLASTPDRG